MAEITITAAPAQSAPPAKSGIKDWITTVDHKKIGILYFWVSFFFFLVAGLEALLVRTQLIVPNAEVLSADVYNQLFTMHAVTMVFLALMPLTAAFFNFLVPLQIGARDVAFPRLNALSFWIYFFGGIFINLGFFLGVRAERGMVRLRQPHHAGLLARPERRLLRPRPADPGSVVDHLVDQLHRHHHQHARAGNAAHAHADFTWMTLITAVLIATAMAVITIGLTQLMFDRFFGTAIYDITKGGDPVLWQHIFWMFGHPEVYILILPIFGMVSEVLPTFSRKPLFGYNVMVFSGILIGWLGWGVWSHHMFAMGLGPIADAFFATSTMLIAIPTGIKIFNWLATLWGGSIRFTTAMLFAVAFIVTFTIGGISGVMHAAAPADLQQTDTYFVVAHIHYVFFGGTVMGLWAGIYYWFPKFFGRMLDERLGQAHFWLTFIGMNVTFFPMHFLGMHGMPRRIFTYSEGLGFDGLNLLATIGSYILGAGTLILAYNLVVSYRRGKPASANPWGAATLEWSIPSPPPEYNFRHTPVVHSRMPLWEGDPQLDEGIPHGRHDEDTEQLTIAGKQIGEVEYPDDESKMSAHDLGIHLPPPSFWPIVLAFAISLFFGGWILHWAVPLVGVALIAFAMYSFAFEPGHSH